MLGAAENDKLCLVSTTPAFTKTNNYTIFTRSAVHNESNCNEVEVSHLSHKSLENRLSVPFLFLH